MDYGCIPLELISDLSVEKHWKVKIKSLGEIESLLSEGPNFSLLMGHISGFVNFLCKIS
jgi:hypothetical protein